MEVIPVIDLLNGAVVHARKGQRNQYSPIQSVLCKDCTAEKIVNSFLSLFPFKTVYIADLNAIMKIDNNNSIIQHLVNSYPHIQFWIDRGFTSNSQPPTANITPVIGSESVTAEVIDKFEALPSGFILSLDFLSTWRLGYKRLFYDSALWPDKVIIMTLSKVGSDSGPDIRRLKYFQNQWPDTTFVAAGGLRDETDLEQLHNHGIKSVLVASALHSGKLTPDILSCYQ